MPGLPERTVVPMKHHPEPPRGTHVPPHPHHRRPTGPTPRDLAASLVAAGTPAPAATGAAPAPGGRRLVLVDLDNVTGMTDLDTEQWRALLQGLRPALGVTDRDHLIIAMCRRTLAQAIVALAEVPAHLLAKTDPTAPSRPSTTPSTSPMPPPATRRSSSSAATTTSPASPTTPPARHARPPGRQPPVRMLAGAAPRRGTWSGLDPDRLIRDDHTVAPHRRPVRLQRQRSPATRPSHDTPEEGHHEEELLRRLPQVQFVLHRQDPTVSSGVSAARLHQKSGASNTFGGYTKVSNSDGTFRMRKTGK